MNTLPISRPMPIHVLAWLGVFPFVLCALGIWLFPPPPGWLPDYPSIVNTYGLLILGFMAGAWWGQMLTNPGQIPLNLFLTSNVFALCGFLGALLLPQAWQSVSLGLLFLLLLVVDRELRRQGVIDAAYWRTRVGVTLVVLACLVLVALAPDRAIGAVAG